MIHRHNWKVLSQDAVGYFEKQKNQLDSEVAAPGTVFKCSDCSKMIIEPSDLKLRIVEVLKYD